MLVYPVAMHHFWMYFGWASVLACVAGQYAARQELPPPAHDDGAGWDIRLAVPGEPGRDYPTHSAIVRTGFSCAGKQPGYYADVETDCQVFRVCTIGATFGYQSFLCPNGTIFNQKVNVCDWWMNVNCQASEKYFPNSDSRFGRLRVGSAMMDDIRKMLTYPMVHPYDINTVGQNGLVMQIYQPPSGQLFQNAALASNRQRLQNLEQFQYSQNRESVENVFSGSTPNPQYVPANSPGNLIASDGQYSQVRGSYNQQRANLVQEDNQNSQQNSVDDGQYRAEYQEPHKSNAASAFSGRYTNGQQYNQNHRGIEITFTKQQYSFPSQYDKQYTYNVPTAETIRQAFAQGHIQDVKQNLVSRPTTLYAPPNTLIPPKVPAARITVKTWLASKPAQLKSDQTGYTYKKPTVPSRLYLSPTTYRPSRLYLTPTTTKPSVSRLYSAPPSKPPTISSRLYLAPSRQTALAQLRSTEPQPVYNRQEQLHFAASTARPVYLAPLKEEPKNQSIIITKHSRINTNHNNLTFTDILTKEKLDITVNDIVKHTGKILSTANTKTFEQLRQGPINSINPQYLSPEYKWTIAENITKLPLNSPTPPSKTARLVSAIPNHLEPPVGTENSEVPRNPIAQLPFYRPPESLRRPTSERTVSLKISIPERTAAYILRTKNDSDYDNLEILNTGSSNYLVLTNNKYVNENVPHFIPLGKLILDRKRIKNISDSQALVYEYLSNSLNTAKSYQEAVNSFDKNLSSKEDISDITEQISRLTSAQYSQGTDDKRSEKANLVATVPTTPQNSNRGIARYTANQRQNLNKLYSTPALVSQNTISSNSFNGKLRQQTQREPVLTKKEFESSVVTDNSHPNSETSGPKQYNSEIADSQQTTTTNSKEGQSNEDVETFEPSLSPQAAPAKLQVEPTISTEVSSLNEQPFPTDGLSAQFHKKLEGAFVHPQPEKKLVTFKKDQSYYVYTKYTGSNNEHKDSKNTNVQKSGALKQLPRENEIHDDEKVLSVQFIPSLSFQLEDERDQQNLLNILQKNEHDTENAYPSSNSGYDYPQNNQPVLEQIRSSPATLYAGPSSYSAPQASVGQLNGEQKFGQLIATSSPPTPPPSDYAPARLEDFDENLGYPKVTPAIPFTF